MKFTQGQKIGITVLISLIIIFQGLIFFKEYLFTKKSEYMEVEIIDFQQNIVSDEIESEKVSQNANIKKIKIDINSATKEDFLKIVGIKDKLSERIIKFRDKLGGFVEENQYREVYGLNDYIMKQMKVNFYINTKKIKKINLRIASFREILSHPYLDYENTKKLLKLIKNNKNQEKEIEILLDYLELDSTKKKYLKYYLVI